MRTILILLTVLLASLSTFLTKMISSRYGERLDIGGHKLRVRIDGQDGPSVVLETSGLAPLDCWAFVQPEVATFARVFAYDHAGYWGSQAGPKPRDAQQIVRELHAALHRAQLPPPYVLVGYSFGGPFIRVFAHLFPSEVAGMVLVDPSQEEAFDWLRIHHPEVNRILPEEERVQDEWGCSWASLNQARKAWPLPDVPVILITAMRHDGNPFLREVLPVWFKAHHEWLKRIPRASHIVTEKSGHGILFQEPGLVVEAIRQVVDLGQAP